VAGGWAAIDPPSTAIGWVERGSLELEAGDRSDPTRGWVVVPLAVVRSGVLGARMPGPPWVDLPRGARVRLVDRDPVTIGRESGATTWLAVVPPAGASCYVRADGLGDAARRDGVSEVLASYLVPEGGDSKASGPLPSGVAAEIERVDATQRAMLTGQPIDQWRFVAIRADYQAILKRSGDNPAVEDALRGRLARVTRLEQAAAAAREFQQTLERTRRHDADVARLEQRLAAVDRYRTITYHAIGFVQPSSRLLDGKKLHVLIGRDGRTIAYLDVAPGLDIETIGTRRVGVRGAVHYNQELGTRLITVRDLEPVGPRR
jgi:hypothetical protein